MDQLQKKVFIISLDGATFDILKPLIDMGYLPNLKRLMASGSHTDLESTIPSITPAAWSSFMTGKLPEKHGIFDFLQYIPQTKKTRFVSSLSIRSKTIWQILSEKGKRAIVIHVPMTYPPYEINGCMISGFDTPSLNSNFTYPPNLKKEILKLIPDYDFNLARGNDYFFDEDYEKFIEKIKRSLDQRYLLAAYLLEKESWDVFMVQFQDLDRIQHNIWHYINVNENGLSLQRKARVYECYSYLDQLIGKLLDKIDKVPHYTIILSDHGFGGSYSTIHPNSLLKEWGFLHVNSKKKQNMSHRIDRLYRLLRNPVKELTKKASDLESRGRITYSNHILDWTKTRAYVPLADIGALCYINRKGREPGGIVADGDYAELCDQLRDKFLSVIEPLSRKRAFADVIIGKDYFKNDDSDLPDLILIPNDGIAVSPHFAINGVYSESVLSGTHRINGVLIVQGENVKQGHTGFKAHIIDIAPTIFYILGLPVPSDVDGRPLLDLFTLEGQKIKWEDTSEASRKGKEKLQDFTEEEKELMEKKLKNLGYL